jgi:hypothetical protein
MNKISLFFKLIFSFIGQLIFECLPVLFELGIIEFKCLVLRLENSYLRFKRSILRYERSVLVLSKPEPFFQYDGGTMLVNKFFYFAKNWYSHSDSPVPNYN